VTAHPFSKVRWETILLVAEGYSYEEIAARLRISGSTVRQRLADTRKQVGAKSTTALIAECYDRGWLVTPQARIEHEEEHEDWPTITPAQRAYLTVFDRMLRTTSGSASV